MQVMIQEDCETMVLIHLEFRRPGMDYERQGKVLTGKVTTAIACAPNLAHKHATLESGPSWQRSDDPRAVTCPTCKETAEFAKAMHRIQTMGKALT